MQEKDQPLFRVISHLGSIGVTYQNTKSIFRIRCTGNLGTDGRLPRQVSFLDLGALYGRIKKGHGLMFHFPQVFHM